MTGAITDTLAICLSSHGATAGVKLQIVGGVYAAVIAFAFLLALFFLKADCKESNTKKENEFESKQVRE